MITMDPVAYFHAKAREKGDVPRQGVLEKQEGIIRFLPGRNFEQALQDLEGMERIWVLFWMHKAVGWKAKVRPPRLVTKKGVFATRAPHRPNPIGLSCVELVKVEGRELKIACHDLLDGTPILDVKPYLPYADSFPDSSLGWIGQEEVRSRLLTCTPLAKKQCDFLEEAGEEIRKRVARFFCPLPSNRTRPLGEKVYVQAYKSWRYVFEQQHESNHLLYVFSGYSEEILKGEGESRWGDVAFHRGFLLQFQKEMEAFLALFPCQRIDALL